MLRVLRSKKGIASILGLAVIGTFAAVALANPPSSTFVPSTLATGSFGDTVQLNSDRIKFQTKDPTDVRFQRIDIAPGGGMSGWHHHPGIVIVVVKAGAVTFTHSDCSSTTYGPGQAAGSAFVEGGDDPGQASSTDGATVYATLIAPRSAGVFRLEDAPQTCP